MSPTRRIGPSREAGGDSSDDEVAGPSSGTDASTGSAREPLLPLVAAALDTSSGSTLERLSQITSHSSARKRYSDLEVINDGPGGQVLRVWDNDLQREVALKQITLVPASTTGRTDASDVRVEDDERLERFIDEARITSQLDHPGIVSVHEIAADSAGHVYYTMPLIRGVTLEHGIERLHAGDEEWSWPRAIGAVATVCEAVDFAHRRGVVHQDLKPENVLVGSFREAIVTDWGLARILGRSGSSTKGRVVGTPAYMAPEIPERGGSILGDVYALGAILYAVLTGRTPHQTTVMSNEDRRSLEDILRRAPRAVAELAPEAPPELIAVVERAMAFDPGDRYSAAGDMARDLRDWLECRVVRAYESGPLAELRKWHRRNRGLALALHSLAALAFVAVGVVAWLQSVKAREVAAKELEVDRRSYAAELRLADLSLRAASVAEARAALAACEPELRGWEWEHLDLRKDSSVLPIRPFESGPPLGMIPVAGDALVVASSGGTLITLDRESLVQRATRRDAHAGRITALAASHDGASVFSASSTGELKRWDAQSLALQHELPLGELRPNAIVAASSERLFFLVPEGRLYSLDLRTGDHRILAEGTSGRGVLALAGDPQRLVTSLGDGTLLSFDAQDPSDALARSDLARDVRALAALGPNELLVGTWEGELLVLDPRTLAATHPSHALKDQRISALATSPDGALALVGTASGALHVLDVAKESLRARGRMLGHTGAIISAFVGPDNDSLATASSDESLRSWRASSSATRTLHLSTWNGLFACSDSGDLIAGLGRDGEILVSSLQATGATYRLPDPGLLPSLTFANGGEILGVSSNDPGGNSSRVQLYDSRTGKKAGRIDVAEGAIQALTGCKRAARIATRGSDGRARVWDVESTACLMDVADAHADSVIALCDAGDHLAVVTENLDVQVLELETGAVVAEARCDAIVTCLAFAADDGLLWIGDMSGSVRRLSLTGDSPAEVVHREPGVVHALAPTADGTRLATTASGDPVIRIRSAATGALFLSLIGHDASPHSLTFANEDKVLTSASTDGTVRLWYTRR